MTRTPPDTFDDAAKPRSSWTAMAQRTGTFTQAGIDAFAASCARYAQRPGVGCTSSVTTEL